MISISNNYSMTKDFNKKRYNTPYLSKVINIHYLMNINPVSLLAVVSKSLK